METASGSMVDMVKSLVRLPGPERRQLMRDRLETFAELDEWERQEGCGR